MTNQERAAHLKFVFEHVRMPGEPMAVFIDSVLAVIPELIEPKEPIVEAMNEPEIPAAMALYRKGSAFARVRLHTEILRETIRQYHRDTSI